MNDFITIATYDDYLSANLDKQKLDEQGIDCYLADENTVTIKWILKNALGGIKLRVPAQQTEEALRILNEKREEMQVDFKLEGKEDDLICPNCGSNNTGTEKYSKSIAGWTWLLLGFPITATPIKQIGASIVDTSGRDKARRLAVIFYKWAIVKAVTNEYDRYL